MRPEGSRIFHHLKLCYKQIQIVMHRNNTAFTKDSEYQCSKYQKAYDQNKVPFFCYFFHSLLLLSLLPFLFTDKSIPILKVPAVLLRIVGQHQSCKERLDRCQHDEAAYDQCRKL